MNDTVFDTSIFAAVISAGTRRDRFDLAIQLADLLCDPETPADERDAVMPSVLALTADQDEIIRESLSLQLIGCSDLDPAVIASIAADDDRIAFPFLMNCTAIDPVSMGAIAEAGDEARQCTVAAREDVSDQTIAVIIARGCASAVKALLDNSAVGLDAEQLKQLYVRFWKDGDIVERLLSFDELPLDIRLLETRRASHRMQQLVKANDWVPGDDGKGTVADSQDRAVIAILNCADPAELMSLIAFASAKELLTTSLLLKAAIDGHMHIVERALAWLNSTSLKRVRKLVYDHGALSLRSLTVSAGLPDDCFPIFRAAADVARASRSDKDWPAPERFGRKVVETLMTRHAVISAAEKARILSLVGATAAEPTRSLARHLLEAIERAA